MQQNYKEGQIQKLPLGQQIAIRYRRMHDLEDYLDGEGNYDLLEARYGKIFTAETAEILLTAEQAATLDAESKQDGSKNKAYQMEAMRDYIRRDDSEHPYEDMSIDGHESFGWQCDEWGYAQIEARYEELQMKAEFARHEAQQEAEAFLNDPF